MIYFFVILFFMLILETVVGFGSTSIGIPILSLFLGTEVSVALMSASGAVLCLVIFISQFRKINWREFFIIAASVIPFLPLGYLAYASIRQWEWLLRLIMGLIVSFIAGHELWRGLVRKDQSDLPSWAIYTALVAGAIIEGMFSMGGPLINVYTLTRLKDKTVFRATMSGIWVMTISLSLAFRVFYLEAYTRPMWMAVLYSLPLVVVAFLMGNKLHYRIPQASFTLMVYGAQLISGLLSIAGGIALAL